MSVASKFKMLLKGATNINAFANLVYVVKSMKELWEIYSAFPKTPDGFVDWRKRVKDKIEAKGRFKPGPV